MFQKLAVVISCAVAAFAAPTAQYLTGQWDCAPAGSYRLCQNLWGASSGVGNQNSTLINASGNTISWSTTYTWANNPYNVKSYANVESVSAKGVQLQSITSAPSSWKWHYTSQRDLHADVAYDIWTGWASSGNPASSASSFEIMIWLSAKGGVNPAGGQVTSNISIGGHNWNLWRGTVGSWTVLSFYSANGDIPDFNVDLNEFFKYIIAHQGVSPYQYVQSIQAGTEPFTGQANLVTDTYSVAINH